MRMRHEGTGSRSATALLAVAIAALAWHDHANTSASWTILLAAGIALVAVSARDLLQLRPRPPRFLDDGNMSDSRLPPHFADPSL